MRTLATPKEAPAALVLRRKKPSGQIGDAPSAHWCSGGAGGGPSPGRRSGRKYRKAYDNSGVMLDVITLIDRPAFGKEFFDLAL
jgi:hypothetical protein